MSDDWKHDHPYIAEFTTEPKERERRIEICEGCDKLTKLKVCSECNCFMPLKTWLKTKKCILGKW